MWLNSRNRLLYNPKPSSLHSLFRDFSNWASSHLMLPCSQTPYLLSHSGRRGKPQCTMELSPEHTQQNRVSLWMGKAFLTYCMFLPLYGFTWEPRTGFTHFWHSTRGLENSIHSPTSAHHWPSSSSLRVIHFLCVTGKNDIKVRQKISCMKLLEQRGDRYGAFCCCSFIFFFFFQREWESGDIWCWWLVKPSAFMKWGTEHLLSVYTLAPTPCWYCSAFAGYLRALFLPRFFSDEKDSCQDTQHCLLSLLWRELCWMPSPDKQGTETFMKLLSSGVKNQKSSTANSISLKNTSLRDRTNLLFLRAFMSNCCLQPNELEM